MKATTTRSILLALLLIFSFPVFAQYNSDETKTIEKSKELYRDKKYDKAIEMITKVINTHHTDDDLWTLRCIYEYDRYFGQLIDDVGKINKKLSSGKSVNTDNMKSTEYQNSLILACFSATLYCSKQDFASVVLHELLYEPTLDTTVSDDAKDLYNKGLEDYNSQSYTQAIRSFQKALDMDSTYYGAANKIALSYFNDEKYDEAIPCLQRAIRLQPDMPDPHKKLVTCYMKTKKWQDAYNACIDGIVHYPDDFFFMQLDEIADHIGKTFNRHWMEREYVPNVASAVNQEAIDKDPWSFYRQGKDKIGDYCDGDGIINSKQTLTQQKYMEPYCWEYMLKKSDTNDGEFEFARKMQDAGYLDCFCFVSMFHIAYYKQYKDFAKNNADRIKTYIDTYLMK